MPSSLIYDLDLEPQSVWYTVSATPLAKSSLLYAQEIGNFYAGPKYNTSRDSFPSYLLKLSLDGCGIRATAPIPRGKAGMWCGFTSMAATQRTITMHL